MKLPSLWPVVCFAGGILLSGKLPAHLHLEPRFSLLVVAFLLLTGFVALYKDWVLTAGIAATIAWLSLGYVAVSLERMSVPANLASSLVESGKLDSSVALRWRGRLRADPLALPWGARYEINLEEVEAATGVVPVRGGLRVTSYAEKPNAAASPLARAGDRVEVLVRALPVRNFGNPGSFDDRRTLAFQGIHLQGTLRDDQLLTILGRPRLTISERLARMRGLLLRSINGLFVSHPDRAALARAMLLGDRSFVEHDRVVEFQQTGVYHVLVLAGLHVGALTAFFIWAGRRLRLALISRTVLTLIALAVYVGIVEDRPPILRAALMAALYLSARLLYRRMDLLNVAALSALGILAARPAEITDPSFLLSFSAVGIIGALAAPWIAHTSEPYQQGLEHLMDIRRDVSHIPRVIQFRIELRAAAAWIAARLPRSVAPFGQSLLVLPLRGGLYLWELIVISAILQLGMLPPLAYYFHRVTLAGPLANIPGVFLTGLIVPLGLLMLASSLASSALAVWLAKLLGILLALLARSVEWFAGWRGASYRIPEPPLNLIAAFAAIAVVLSVTIRSRRLVWQWVATTALLAAATLIATHPFAPNLSAGNLEVTVLDVGQGDSLFVTFPGGHTMLVDAGGALGSFHADGMRSGLDIGEDVVSPYLWSRGLKQIEVVALTHAHQDHLGGLPAVLENFRVQELWVGRDIGSTAYREVLAIAHQRGVHVIHTKQGDTFTRGVVSGAILWPEDLTENQTAKNDDSLVMRLTDGTQSILLPGDIERPSERVILAENEAVGANFLKVAHHGSKTSTIEPFLSSSHPAFAAISAGRDNSFGHPSPEVVERLEAAGVRVYRTDRDGAITATTDGQTLTLSTFLHANPQNGTAFSAATASGAKGSPSPPQAR
jgi:competence protein ComEC